MSTKTIISPEEIERRIAEGQLIVVHEGYALKLDDWITKHPGGRLAILHMVGRDATDEINIYHSPKALLMMKQYRMGSIQEPWVSLQPPIRATSFSNNISIGDKTTSPLDEEKSDAGLISAGCRKRCLYTPNGTELDCNANGDLEKGGILVNDPEKQALLVKPKISSRIHYAMDLEQKEIDQGILDNPSLDAETQRSIIVEYRNLHEKIKQQGLFKCRYTEYYKELIRYSLIFMVFLYLLNAKWYLTSSVVLGIFWQQIMFTAHDAGHRGITGNFITDTLIGAFVADFCCGLSIGWWKSSHNVHHLVTNMPEHDPDIQNVPLFSTSPTYIKSIVSSFYNFVFIWNGAADFMVQYQKYTYYPVMALARFNLYLLSWLHLVSPRAADLGTAWWTRPVEVVFMVCYWIIFGYGLVWRTLPNWPIRIAFVLISHMITMLLHVQITLSHWGMPTADLGPMESFPQRQLRTTMDVDCPAWLDFLHGGLQFQAVHHLFPRIPRHNLRQAQALVREFCDKTKIKYQCYGFVEGNQVVLNRLEEIARMVEIMVKCQSHMAETGEIKKSSSWESNSGLISLPNVNLAFQADYLASRDEESVTEKMGSPPGPEAMVIEREPVEKAAPAVKQPEDVRAYDIGKPEIQQKNVGTLHRKLKSRHVQFLALSGAIGTGLFVGSGQVLSLAGPLSAFLAYLITGGNLYAVITSMGEMGTWLPLPGAVPVYAARYVDPALGFTLGWNYWYQFAIGVPIEISASVLILGYWPNPVPTGVWITIFFVALVLLNCLPVKFYGETEFIFGAIKLTTIVGLIILMFSIMLGGSPSGDRIGFRYWKNPGPMNEYLKTGDLGRFLAFWKVFIQATFSYGGSEMVVIAAGETEHPRRNIPKAVRRVFWRILLFYVLAIFLVGMCVSSKDKRLLNALDSRAPGVGTSPFVIAIANGGIKVLPHILNAVVLSSAFSAGNSFFYASTRVLYAIALDGKAPRFLCYEKFGVPYACVAATSALSLLIYLNVSASAAEVFFWISNLSSVSTLIVWASISITYIRFHKGMAAQGIPRSSLPYRAPFQPYLAWFAVFFCSIVAVFNGFDAFFPGKFSAKSFVPPYVDIPIFASLFLGYKFISKTRFVRLHEMDFFSGKDEIDQLESTWVTPVPRNFLGELILPIADEFMAPY
ncbi:hypothetical protein FQN57_000544 [Myotisia sp. PD_48]|nr:hypothetical protein FQN57_000544 [Myotisia sp. PD_48]